MPRINPTATINMDDAFLKAQAYCAYQERCHAEVRDKLYEWGLWPDGVEQTLVKLIEENFLNEERFAKAYAGGKFRIKKWGRIKIKLALKQKQVSAYCIKKALSEIPAAEYLKTLQTVIAQKQKTVKEKDRYKRNYKVAQYAMSRGFEGDLVWDILNTN